MAEQLHRLEDVLTRLLVEMPCRRFSRGVGRDIPKPDVICGNFYEPPAEYQL